MTEREFDGAENKKVSRMLTRLFGNSVAFCLAFVMEENSFVENVIFQK